MIRNLGHISIRTRDIELSTKFYRDILGVPFSRREETERFYVVFLQLGDTEIELLQLKNGEYEKRADGPVDHMAFFVEDLDAAMQKLKEHQVVVLSDTVREVFGWRVMFVQGPDGERIELMEVIK
ncbi:VOC family protein [Geosporobacter ferrireducens]|uniref:VOC family protein n=1 Tax=Geosporobacter ferrireducens TaxID=1424294 RepID=UPI00139CE32F|nr:VOC family protein [Geosporobacter ferrireducens]MTI53484.1 hypothetical protein [Geosporobacter ferrireducens]